MVRLLASNSIYAKQVRNGPPNASQVVSTDELRCGHAVCTLWVHPPTSPIPPFLLKQNLFPIDIAGHVIINETFIMCSIIYAMGPIKS